MLRAEVCVAERLEAQLEEQARRFLAEKYFARCADVLGDDARARDTIASGKFALQFLDYDWSLNDAKR